MATPELTHMVLETPLRFARQVPKSAADLVSEARARLFSLGDKRGTDGYSFSNTLNEDENHYDVIGTIIECEFPRSGTEVRWYLSGW